MAAKRNKDENASAFVLELPLIVEKWQSDQLDKRYELLRRLYNFAQRKLLRQYTYLTQSREYKQCKTKKAKFDFFRKHTFHFKEAEDAVLSFTEFGINAFVTKLVKLKLSNGVLYKNLGLNTSHMQTLAAAIWASWHKKIDGKGKRINFKKYAELNLLKVPKKNGRFAGHGINLQKMTISFNLNGAQCERKKKLAVLRINTKKLTEYEKYALKGGVDSIVQLGIVRREVRGKNKYYVQLTIREAIPRKNRQLGVGNVGMDLGPSKLAIVSNNQVGLIELRGAYTNIQRHLRRIERKMDRSRRSMNPDNYASNGTIQKKKGMRWSYSNNYKHLRTLRKELFRRMSALRKLSHITLANELLSLGNVFIVEDNPISAWSRRAKETKQNKKGKFVSKKRFGRTILNHAPAQLIEILKNKVEALGGTFAKVPIANAATQFDFTNGTFTKHELNERTVTLSNGDTHHRDLLAAFNLQHLLFDVDNLNDKDNIKKYNIQDMFRDYNNFCTLEQKAI